MLVPCLQTLSVRTSREQPHVSRLSASLRVTVGSSPVFWIFGSFYPQLQHSSHEGPSQSDIFLRHSEVVLVFFSGLSLFGVLATGCALEWEERSSRGSVPGSLDVFQIYGFTTQQGAITSFMMKTGLPVPKYSFSPHAHPSGGLIISFRPQRLDINIDWSVIHYTQINSCCKFLNFLCYYYCATCSYMKVTHLLGFLVVLVPAAWLALSVSFLQAAQMQQNTNKITLIFNTT